MILKDISKSFGASTVLDKVSFIVNEGEHVAIVGVNGAGKTTLFRIITGELAPDEGNITVRAGRSGRTVGYLSQNNSFEKGTILDEFYAVFEDITELEKNIRALEQQITNAQEPELSRLLERYNRLSLEFEQKDGYEVDSRVKGVIAGLGFSSEDAVSAIDRFSGGQKTRIALGKLLLGDYGILLLDEPTNHLDIESVKWLEGFLRDYKGSLLVISHDRYFLDRVATKVIEIENTKASIYPGNYTDFVSKKSNEREIKLKQYQDQQKEIKRQEEIIKQLRAFNREKSVKRAESREKLLAKVERVEKPPDLPDTMRLSHKLETQSGQLVMEVTELSKSYDEVLFKNISFAITKGEHVALVGKNGVGKTTLFRIIQKTVEADTGTIRLGTNVKVGYYDQEHKNLNEENTVFDEIQDAYPKLTNEQIRNTLAAFVFTGEDVYKVISSLSGGEKGRVSLAKIILSGANFLLLDEPTNHLDIYSKEILEKFLKEFEGTIFYISHDRYFINSTADKVIEMSDGGVTAYLGNYDYYIEKSAQTKKEQVEALPQKVEKQDKNDWAKKKEQEAEVRKRQSRIKRTEDEIERLEQLIKDCDDDMQKVSDDAGKLHELYEKKSSHETSLEEQLKLWEELNSDGYIS